MKTSTSSPACSGHDKAERELRINELLGAPGWRRFAIAPPENSPVG